MAENNKQFFMRMNLDNVKDRRIYDAIREHEGFTTSTKMVKEVILEYLDRKEAAISRQQRKRVKLELPPEEQQKNVDEFLK